MSTPRPERERVPLMRTKQEAVAQVLKTGDNFYVSAVMIEEWLGQLIQLVTVEYAEKKQARERHLQEGQAAALFEATFPKVSGQELVPLFQHLLRYAQVESPLAELLFRAVAPLSHEHMVEGGFTGPQSVALAPDPVKGEALLRRHLSRWWDWLDAEVHWQAHLMWHEAPVCFDPDPERRDLAVLGFNQRFYAHMTEASREHWQWHHAQAAEEHKDSPQWPKLGAAMADERERSWAQPQVDQAVIRLWPLVKRHDWTFGELRTVLTEEVGLPDTYPLQQKKDLAAHCVNVLGLRKGGGPGRGPTRRDGPPPGREVVRRWRRSAVAASE